MSNPLWLEIAKKELGVKEVDGDGNNPRIIQYHAQTTLKATEDKISWCSSFVNWALYKAGIKGTQSAAARSWLNWGRELKVPRVGAVVVLWRGKKDSWQGHVAFYVREDEKYYYLLGGNQNNEVNISPYLKSRVLGIRWPS